MNPLDGAAGMGTTGQSGTNPSVLNPVGSATSTDYNVGQGMQTSDAEALGGAAGDHFNEMNFSIEKVTVTAKSSSSEGRVLLGTGTRPESNPWSECRG